MGQHTAQPSQHQVEALMQIGEYLHEVREQKLLSLEQVAAQTMIQARLLRAIETSDFNQLPEPIYIRGFIRRYSEALGLDADDIASRFPVELDRRAIQPSWHQSTRQLRPTHLWLAYTAIIIIAIGGLHQYLTRFSSTSDRPDDSVETTERSPNDSDPSAESTRPSPSATTPPASDENQTSTATGSLIDPDINAEPPADTPDAPLQVTVELTQRSWMRVIVDGQQEIEEVLPEGTKRTWTGNESITIRAGNAGGVLLTRGNGDAEVMGELGTVQEVSFSADNTNDDQ